MEFVTQTIDHRHQTIDIDLDSKTIDYRLKMENKKQITE